MMVAAALVALVAAAPGPAIVAGAPDLGPQDSLEALKEAREAQARFERERRTLLPWTLGAGGGECGEVVGRFCWRPDRSRRAAPPEPPAIGRARLDLLVHLAGLAGRVPGDRWIAGQRVRYRVEGAQVALAAHLRARRRARAPGASAPIHSPADPAVSATADPVAEALEHLEAAENVARECRKSGEREGWCAALLGLVLHVSGRVREAERTFAEAAREAPWLSPVGRDLTDVMERDTRRAFDQAPDTAAFLERFWAAADPFWSIPGNDRRTEHYARRVMARIQGDARNAFGLPWGDDLRELHVRFGWEVGWERARRSSATLAASDISIIGHQQDDGYAFLPGAGALVLDAGALAPDAGAALGAWTPGVRPRREGYRPVYVDTIGDARHQLAAFRRGDSLVVRVAMAAPASSNGSASRANPFSVGRSVRGVGLTPWPTTARSRSARGGAPGFPPEPAVFPGGPDGAAPAEAATTLRAVVPAGAYIVSVEAIDPDGMAFRARYPIRRDTIAAGVLAVSDLMLHAVPDDPLTSEPGGPLTVEEAAPGMLRGTELRAGQRVGVFWEVYGLHARGEAVAFDVSLGKRGESFLRRAGRWLGLADRVTPVRVRWTDAARPTRQVYGRSVRVTTPPDLAPGEYVLRLVVRTAGRDDAVSERTITIR